MPHDEKGRPTAFGTALRHSRHQVEEFGANPLTTRPIWYNRRYQLQPTRNQTIMPNVKSETTQVVAPMPQPQPVETAPKPQPKVAKPKVKPGLPSLKDAQARANQLRRSVLSADGWVVPQPIAKKGA
jgi:hypothetical protein